MPDITIRHALSQRPLFTGPFTDIKACLEQAVADNADLTGADLRHANLANAELDGARLKGARLDHTNLTGANMSEARMDGAIFTGAALQNACLCFSILNNCDFTNASFGATDIAGAKLDHARFSTLSAFTLNFRDAATFQECLWFNEDGMPCSFSRPPVAITGLLQPIILLDCHVQIGPATLRMEDWATPDIRGLRATQALHPFINAMRRPLAGFVQNHALPAHVCGKN